VHEFSVVAFLKVRSNEVDIANGDRDDPNFKSKIKKEYLRFLSESFEFSTSFSICLAAVFVDSFAHPTAVDGTSHKVQGPAVDEIDRLIFSCLID